MNKQLFFLSVLTISTFGQTICSSHEQPARKEEEALEILLSYFKSRSTPICISDRETGMSIKSALRDNTPAQRTAEELKSLMKRDEQVTYVPVYNGADCALMFQVFRAAGVVSTYKVCPACTEIIMVPDDLQRLAVSGSSVEPGKSYPIWMPARFHRSVYAAKDILPISEALMFLINNEDKVALSVGGNMVVPVEIEDTVHRSSCE